MRAIILAGGFGKRLRPLTDTIAKSMVPVAGKPILLRQLEWLRGHGVDELVLCVGHLKETIVDYFGDGETHGVTIRYVVEDRPLGTAGAFRNAMESYPSGEPFFGLNGDVVTDLDPVMLVDRLRRTNAVAAIALVPLPSPFGEVVTDDQERVTSFLEKPRLMDHWINAGVYCLAPSIASYLPKEGSIENDVFPILAREGKLVASKQPDEFWTSIDSPKDIEAAAARLAQGPQEPSR